MKEIPALSTVILQKDTKREDSKDFHNWIIIRKLNFLEKSTRPDISYAIHQCMRFSENPKQSHGEAVQQLGHYLKHTQEKGL